MRIDIGRLGGLTQVVFASLLGGLSALAREGSPEFLPRGFVLLAVYSLPGIIGLLGVAQRRPALLLAAAAASTIGSVLAFSGVTLIFLVPAMLFLVGAVRMASEDSVAASMTMRRVFGGVLLATILTVLMIGAGASALIVTDEQCWTTYQTPGGVRYELAPYTTGEMQVPVGALSFSCSTGVISARGVGLAGLLGGGALGLAMATGRRRPDACELRPAAP